MDEGQCHMRLGIDASNLRTGGGVTHLVELLRVADPFAYGFSKVIVWSGQTTLSRIEDRPWLLKSYQSTLDKSLPFRSVWQRFRLSKLARLAGCDVLLVPGGSFAGNFHPVVAMSRNMLPFEREELRRYGWSQTSFRLHLLRWVQSRTFRRADGLVFLTQYAREAVLRVVRQVAGITTIISHGIDERFFCPPREQLAIHRYSVDRPFRVLYVSIIDVYKHQWQVAEAVARLRVNRLPVVLDLVGPAYPPAFTLLNQTLSRIDPIGEFVRYFGAEPYKDLHARYTQADLCVFASSCENMPNILLEGMASGLPIACSNRGPMPEVLGNAGVYFDPEKPEDIARALQELIDSPELRARLAKASFERARDYSWKTCASDTFTFLAQVSRQHGGNAVMPVHA